MSFVQLVLDHAATTLKSTALVSNLVHTIRLDLAARGEQALTDSVQMSVGVLPVCCTRKTRR